MPITEGMIIAGLTFLKYLIEKIWQTESSKALITSDEKHEFVKQSLISYMKEKGIAIGNIDVLIEDVVELVNKHGLFEHKGSK